MVDLPVIQTVDSLPAFLYARYAEEAEAAVRAQRDGTGSWRFDVFDRSGGVVYDDAGRPLIEFSHDPDTRPDKDLPVAQWWQAEHAARYDPERVLREIEAKRGVIRRIFQYEATVDSEWGCGHGPDAIRAGLCPETDPDDIEVLRLLALPYAGHPGYREAWRP